MGALGTAGALALLAVVVWAALTRPRGLPELVFAAPAAGVALAAGLLRTGHAQAEVTRLGPTLGFLAAVLALAKLCDDDGLFVALGELVAGAARGQPRRLFAGVTAVAAAVTTVLSLDATVVLLTPVVLVVAQRARVRPRPHLYLCGHLANSGSLLLPVSNLTNLLAFAVIGLSFWHFAALMALPAVVAVLVEYLLLRVAFRSDLELPAPGPAAVSRPVEVPIFSVTVLAGTLGGFVVTSLTATSPALAAGAGAGVLAVRALLRRRATVIDVVLAADPQFVLFVLALALVVRAAADQGLSSAVTHLLPAGQSLPVLLAVAAVAALLSNVMNNLPATLVLLAALARSGTGPMLALLLGVNIGPNLTFVGSLATLLWRRVLAARGVPIPVREFTVVGLLSVPVTLLASVVALWLSLHVV